MLAVALARPSNLMVLDEPTNDLDLETLDLLQEMLADYQGTVLLVSHDRDFLDRVVTSTIAFEGDGRWVEYAGGYSDMLSQRGVPDVARGEPRRSGAPVGKPAAAGSAKPAARKMSFKDRHALELLPAEMEKWQKEMAAHQAVLDDPQVFARDPKRFDQALAGLAKAQSGLHSAEQRWLELETLREELGA
jgi:ATP-binding cassette subfamily F protein uup